MILPDLNLLLYAHDEAAPAHTEAHAWFEDLMRSAEVGFAQVVVFGFLRLATRRGVLASPLSVEAAARHVEGWLSRPNARLVLPGPRHVETVLGLLRAVGTGGNLTTDAQIAALALEYQGEVHSNDDDFRRFPGLRWKNPLIR